MLSSRPAADGQIKQEMEEAGRMCPRCNNGESSFLTRPDHSLIASFGMWCRLPNVVRVFLDPIGKKLDDTSEDGG